MGKLTGSLSPFAPEFSLPPSIHKELMRTSECVLLLGSVLPPFGDHRLVISVFLSENGKTVCTFLFGLGGIKKYHSTESPSMWAPGVHPDLLVL